MILTGRYLSPFVRRVAIWLALQGRAYEHQPIMVTGDDFERLKQINPFGRVPALTLDDGTTLVETWAIIDWLEETAPSGKRLLPADGAARLRALQGVAAAHNLAEKGVALVYETVRRPKEFHWLDWIERVRGQAKTGLDILESHAHLISVESAPGVAAATIAAFDFVALMHASLVGESYPALKALSAAANARTEFSASKPTL